MTVELLSCQILYAGRFKSKMLTLRWQAIPWWTWSGHMTYFMCNFNDFYASGEARHLQFGVHVVINIW